MIEHSNYLLMQIQIKVIIDICVLILTK